MSTTFEPVPRVPRTSRQEDVLLERLARVTARWCTDDALLISSEPRAFIDALRARHRRVLAESTADEADIGCAVIIAHAAGDIAALPERLQSVWARLRVGGRLLIAVPNEDAREKKDGNALGEGALRRLLEPLGRPLLISEQPFEWLLMYVDRKKSSYGGVPRSRTERFEAMADLCRGSVAELGCGAGELAAAIHACGHAVVGVDMNGPKIERARQSFPGVEFIEADICEPGLLEGRQFDTVVLAEVLEHVPEPIGDAMLAVARRLLGPNGRIVVSVPNRNCIPHRNHIRVFDRKALQGMLAAFGEPRTVTVQPYKWLLMYADLR